MEFSDCNDESRQDKKRYVCKNKEKLYQNLKSISIHLVRKIREIIQINGVTCVTILPRNVDRNHQPKFSTTVENLNSERDSNSFAFKLSASSLNNKTEIAQLHPISYPMWSIHSQISTKIKHSARMTQCIDTFYSLTKVVIRKLFIIHR